MCADILGGLPCSACMPADLKALAKAETLMGGHALVWAEEERCELALSLPCENRSWESAALMLAGASADSVPA